MSDVFSPRRGPRMHHSHPHPHPHPHAHAAASHHGGWQRCAAGDCEEYGDPNHFGYCPRHLCKKPTCQAPRAEGTSYCIRHACDLTTCSRSRLDTSAYCNQHACQYAGCTASKRGSLTAEGATSEACENHICQSESCSHPRRSNRLYCKLHSCGWAGRMPCNQEVEAGGTACRDHVCQFEGGCSEIRKVKTNSQACDAHTCRISGCYQVVGVRGKFCPEHTCIWEPCSQRGRFGGSPYCETHKCKSAKCSQPIRTKLDEYCNQHRCQYDGVDCAGGWSKLPPFCAEHTCTVKGCHEPVMWTATVCEGHVRAHSQNPPSHHGQGQKKSSKSDRSQPYIEENDPGYRSHGEHSTTSHRSARSSKSHRPRSKGSAGPLTTWSPEKMQVATSTHSNLIEYSLQRRAGQNPQLPAEFREDPGMALAYGCGMQDAIIEMMKTFGTSGRAIDAPTLSNPMDRYIPKMEEKGRVVELDNN